MSGVTSIICVNNKTIQLKSIPPVSKKLLTIYDWEKCFPNPIIENKIYMVKKAKKGINKRFSRLAT